MDGLCGWGLRVRVWLLDCFCFVDAGMRYFGGILWGIFVVVAVVVGGCGGFPSDRSLKLRHNQSE